MRHLLLGGNGFIGQQVARRLKEVGEEVTLAVRQPDLIKSGVLGNRAIRFNLSQTLRDYEEMVSQFDVIHLYAWAHTPSTAAREPTMDVSVNLVGTLRLLEAIRRNGLRRLIFASSGGTIYGQGLGRPSKEEDVPSPLGAYGISKLAAEHYIKLFCEEGHLDGRIARISNPYGVEQRAEVGFGVIAHFSRKILSGDVIQIFGNGTAVRDFIHAHDLAEALFLLATQTLPSTCTICNVGSGRGVSLNQLVDKIERLSRRKAVLEYLPERYFDVKTSELDVGRMHDLFAWKPMIDLEEGLRRLLGTI